MRKGKWKARIQTAFTALGIFILVTIVSSILTAVYYSWGNPDRVEVYRGIIDHTLTITKPHGHLGGTSTNTSPYFGLKATKNMRKRVGNARPNVGELEVNFRFSLMSQPKISGDEERHSQAFFVHPDSTESATSDWDRLNKLPEGTVALVYISFDDLLETKDVEQLFTDKEMDLLWLAVDTGLEQDIDFGFISDPIGFPSSPIWHDDDMIVHSQEEKPGLFGSKIISKTSSSPLYRSGNQKVLHDQFMKTLLFLQKHERKADQFVFDKLHLEERINYLEQNGIVHYGAVVTGPTKEMLKLREEPMIHQLKIDEVELWN